MTGQTVEFRNTQGLKESLAMCGPSSNPLDISAEPLLDEALGRNCHGMEVEIDQQLSSDEHRPNTRFTHNKPPRFASVAELFGSIAHQLNEPLTSMLANAQAAKRWLAAEPPNLMEAITSIDRIAKDIRTSSGAMECIWALFKQESLDKKEASVPDMIREAVRLVVHNKLEVPIRWQSDENLPKVWVDPLAIQEVFINLISKAIEALDDNSDSPLV